MSTRKFLCSFFTSTLMWKLCLCGVNIDSLKNTLALPGIDTVKVNTLLALSKYYLSSDPLETVKYALQAKDISEKINFDKGTALALKNIGIANFNQSKYIDALQSWQQAQAVYSKINDKAGVANMYSNIGAIYEVQGEDAKALESHLKALKVAELINDTLRIVTALINMGAVYDNKSQNYDKAIQNYMRALPLCEAFNDKDAIGTVTANTGEIYFKRGDDSTALKYFLRSYKAYGDNSEYTPYILNDIGDVYHKRGEYQKAIEYHNLAYEKAKKLDSKLDMTIALIGLAETYGKQNEFQQAIETYKEGLKLAMEIAANNEKKEIYEGLANSYSKLHDYDNAFKYQTLLIGIKDTLYDVDTDKKLTNLLFNFEIDKKQAQVDLLTKDRKIKEQEIKRQKLVRNGFMGGFAVVLLFAGVFFMQRNRISKEKKRSDELLLNILPEETAEELKATGTAKAKSYELVSVLFTDFKNFTQASELLTPEELVQEINYCYSEFDKIITRHGIEKIKTIGDAYMCAGGLPVANNTHPEDIIRAGLEMTQFIEKNKQERIEKKQPFFELRLGIHTGPVVAGIVGIKKFAYDIWGDTVNTASRMESSGEIGRVNISGTTYELVKDKFLCVHRGKVKAKNKGEIDMFFVERPLMDNEVVESINFEQN